MFLITLKSYFLSPLHCSCLHISAPHRVPDQPQDLYSVDVWRLPGTLLFISQAYMEIYIRGTVFISSLNVRYFDTYTNSEIFTYSLSIFKIFLHFKKCIWSFSFHHGVLQLFSLILERLWSFECQSCKDPVCFYAQN